MRFNPHNLTNLIFRNISIKNQIIIRRYCHNKSYKVLFFGSDGIALNSLRKINELRKAEKIISKLDIVTASNIKQRSIIEKFAESEGIRTLTWPLLELKYNDYDVGLIAAFGHLINKDVLDKFPLGMVNVHPSLLPRWRGAAPIIYTLMHGDEVTGVTLMKIKADQFDVGEIINQIKLPVPKDIKLLELTEKLSEIGAEMLVKCMRTLPDSLDNAVPQPDDGVTYAKKIHKTISEVRWSEMSSVQVYNLHRALYGLYPLSTMFKDKHVKLFEAFLIDEENEKINYLSNEIGLLQYCDKNLAIKVLCKDGKYIYFRSMRIVGKRKISALDFYNGYIKNVVSNTDKAASFQNK